MAIACSNLMPYPGTADLCPGGPRKSPQLVGIKMNTRNLNTKPTRNHAENTQQKWNRSRNEGNESRSRERGIPSIFQQSEERGISSRFSQPPKGEVSSRFHQSEHREMPSRFQQPEERGNSSRFHQSQEEEILPRFQQSEERGVPSRSHRPEEERRLPSRNYQPQEEERGVPSRLHQRPDGGTASRFNQLQKGGTPSGFHQPEERGVPLRSHRPEEERIPSRSYQQPNERGIPSRFNSPQKGEVASRFHQSEQREIPSRSYQEEEILSRTHRPEEERRVPSRNYQPQVVEEIPQRFHQSEERGLPSSFHQRPDGSISSWFNQPQVVEEIPPRFHQSDDIPEKEQFHRRPNNYSPEGRRGSEYDHNSERQPVGYNPSPNRGDGSRGWHNSPGRSRSPRRMSPVEGGVQARHGWGVADSQRHSREPPPPRDTTSSSSSCSTRKRSLQKEEELQSKRSNDFDLPALGEPGALDDPRRQNLCDSRIKLYLRYLRAGFEPDEAINMARNKPSSWEKWHNQQQQQPEADQEDNVALKVLLMPRGYPDIKLNHQDKLDLEEAIIMEVAAAQLPTPLRFTAVAFRKGFLEVQCFNRFAADWLMCKGSNLSSYRGPRVETKFHVPTQDEHVIKVFLPCSQDKTNDFLIQLLKSQNDYDFSLWNLVKRNNRGHGSVVVFGIDRKSALDIVQKGHKLFYRMGTVAVRGLKQLEKDLKNSEVGNPDDNAILDEDEDIDGVPIEVEDVAAL